MTILVQLALFCLAVPAVLSGMYLLTATLLSRRLPALLPKSSSLRFDFVVPAHNESASIQCTVESLRRSAWPGDRFRVIVVADNCSDDTALKARAAGALVLVREDPDKRGKGYALRHAFDASRAEKWAEAVVVVDADAEVSANLLTAFAARLEAGNHAVQAHYGVRNPMASWRTRLITIAKGAFHIVRSRARERLGLSCGLRGNGWCVTHELLAKVPYQAFSLTEDIEFGIAIGLAGYRVAYADEAHADADMVSNEEIARKQRQRWEHGRWNLIRGKTGELLAVAFRRRSALCLDLALDLMVLPLSYVTLNILALGISAEAAMRLHLAPPVFLWCAGVSGVCVLVYVLRGWQLSGVGAQGAWDLTRVPWYLIWKILLTMRRHDSKEWVRTGREKSS